MKKDERIDVFLSKETELTRTRIQQLIKEENIKVDNKKVKSSYKIEIGENIEILIPEEKQIDLIAQNININIK